MLVEIYYFITVHNIACAEKKNSSNYKVKLGPYDSRLKEFIQSGCWVKMYELLINKKEIYMQQHLVEIPVGLQ